MVKWVAIDMENVDGQDKEQGFRNREELKTSTSKEGVRAYLTRGRVGCTVIKVVLTAPQDKGASPFACLSGVPNRPQLCRCYPEIDYSQKVDEPTLLRPPYWLRALNEGRRPSTACGYDH